MLLIGSRALNWWAVRDRESNDWDFICSRKEALDFCDKHSLHIENPLANKLIVKSSEFGQFEFELTDTSATGRMYTNICEEIQAMSNIETNYWHATCDLDFDKGYYKVLVAPPSVLFSIKKSHINYPRFWQKHIKDYHKLKEIVHYDIYPDITNIRKMETEERLGKLKTPSLNQTKTNFFKDNVSNKTFIHDDIHAVMAHRELPMYEYIKINPDKVACSKDKFFALSKEYQIQCVLEEAYVIALERRIIPILYEQKQYIDAKTAFDWAVMRICTTLCSGWFRTFAVEEWPNIQAAYNPDYVVKFLGAIETGKIKLIGEK